MLAGELAWERLLAAAPPARPSSPTETAHRSVRRHHLARQAAGVDLEEPELRMIPLHLASSDDLSVSDRDKG